MTIEQPKEDLTSQDIDDTIKIMRLLNLILDSKKIPKKDKQKFFEGFQGMFEQ